MHSRFPNTCLAFGTGRLLAICILALAASFADHAWAGGPAPGEDIGPGVNFCPKVSIGSDEVPITDPRVQAQFQDALGRLRAAPDPAFINSNDYRRNPAYQFITVPFEEVRYPDHVEIRPKFDAPKRSSGFICDQYSATLGRFLQCLEAVSTSYRAAAGPDHQNLRNKFIVSLGAMNNYLPRGSAIEGKPFLADLNLRDSSQETALEFKEKLAALDALKGKCVVAGCHEHVDAAIRAFKTYANVEAVAAAANRIKGEFMAHHHIPDDVFFAPCEERAALKTRGTAVRLVKAEAPADPIAEIFTDGRKNACNPAIPRVICHSSDQFDPSHYDSSGNYHAATVNPDLGPNLPLLAPALSSAAREDIKEYLMDLYLSAWKLEAVRTLNGEQLEQANIRLRSAASCGMATSAMDPNTFTPRVDPQAQMEGRIQAVLAAACERRLGDEFELLQVKHGLGLNIATSGNEIAAEEKRKYIEAATKNMTPEERHWFVWKDIGKDAARGLAEAPVYLTPVGPFLAAKNLFDRLPLSTLSQAYAEKNRCAGWYPASNPLFEECRASFELMNQVGLEASTLRAAFPSLEEDENGEVNGTPGFLRANVVLPKEVQDVVDKYVPGSSHSCLAQARAAYRSSSDDLLKYDARVFTQTATNRRLQQLETRLHVLCTAPDEDIDNLLLSPTMMRRYFDCGSQPPFARPSSQALGCEDRKKLAWIICRESLKVADARKGTAGKILSGTAEAVGIGMDMAAIFAPGAGIVSDLAQGGQVARVAFTHGAETAAAGAALNGGMALATAWAGSPRAQAELQRNLDRERAKVLAGVGDREQLNAARETLSHFQDANDNWLSAHPVASAALQGAVSGFLAGALGAHTSQAAMEDWHARANRTDRRDAAIRSYLTLRECGAFDLDGGAELRATLEKELYASLKEDGSANHAAHGAFVEAGELGQVRGKSLVEMTPEEAIESYANRKKLKWGRDKSNPNRGIAETEERAKARAELQVKDSSLFDMGVMAREGYDPLSVSKIINESPEDALNIYKFLQDRGNDPVKIRKLFGELAKQCPADRNALLALCKRIGIRIGAN